MMDVIVEIMFGVLTTLAIATKEVKRGQFSESMSHIYYLFLLHREVIQERI